MYENKNQSLQELAKTIGYHIDVFIKIKTDSPINQKERKKKNPTILHARTKASHTNK